MSLFLAGRRRERRLARGHGDAVVVYPPTAALADGTTVSGAVEPKSFRRMYINEVVGRAATSCSLTRRGGHRRVRRHRTDYRAVSPASARLSSCAFIGRVTGWSVSADRSAAK